MRVVHRFRHCHSGLLVRRHTDFTRNAPQKHDRTVYTGHDDVRDQQTHPSHGGEDQPQESMRADRDVTKQVSGPHNEHHLKQYE